MSSFPSPSKSSGTAWSVASPQFTAVNPADERLRYQILSEGRNTDTSDSPSPSKSVRVGRRNWIGISKLSVTTVLLLPVPGFTTAAFTPNPRIANPRHIGPTSPGSEIDAATMIASRELTIVGFNGDSFIPSVTYCSTRRFPSAAPWHWISWSRTSHSVTAHISPILCAWSHVVTPNGPRG